MRNTFQKLACVLTALLLVSLSFETSAAPPHTGVQGRTFVYISYGTPFEIEPGVWIGIPGVQFPVATSFRILAQKNGREVARGTSDGNGDYAVSLPPGNYILVMEDYILGKPPFDCSASTAPIMFTVQPHQMTLANVFYFRDGPCGIFSGETQ